MNKCFFCILMCFLNYLYAGSSDLSSREQMAYKLMGKFAKKMEKQGLNSNGFGSCQKDGKQDVLEIMFKTEQVLTIESTRALSVKCVNEFVSYINDNGKFRKYLVIYPFTQEHVSVTISGIDATEHLPTFVRTVAAGEGFVRYYSDEMTPPKFGLILKETFQEATHILNQQ